MAGEIRVATVSVGVIPDAREFVRTLRAQVVPGATTVGKEVGTIMSAEVAGSMNMGGSVSKSVRATEGEVRAASRQMGAMVSGEVAGSMSMGQNVAKSVEKESGAIKSAGAKAGTGFVDAMKAPFSAITGMIVPLLAIGGGVALFKGIIDQGSAAAKSTKIVQQAISATGGAAHVTSQQVQELASSQSKATGVDRAAIQQSDALLLRFTNIRNEAGKNNDVFNRTSQAALDMTAALNKGQVTSEGLTNTTKILGKALEDPAKGMNLLRRYGIQLTQQQQDQVKALEKSGDTLGAQKIILDQVNASYGGTAAKMATGSAKIKASLGEMEATIGQQLLPIISKLITALAQVINALGPMIDWFFKGSTSAQIFRDVIITLVAAFAAYTVAMKIKNAVDLISGKYTLIMEKATKAYALTSKEASVTTRLWATAQMLLNGALDANPIGIIVIAVAALGLALYEAYKHSAAFRDIVKEVGRVLGGAFLTAFHTASSAINSVREAFRNVMLAWTGFIGQWTTSSHLFSGTVAAVFNFVVFHIRDLINSIHSLQVVIQILVAFWRAEWNLMAAVVKIVFALIGAEVKTGIAIITGVIKVAMDILHGNWRQAWNDMLNIIRSVTGAWSGAVRSAVSAITGAINPLLTFVRSTVPGAFKAGADAVVGALQHLVSAIAAPIDAITSKLSSIGNVFNKITGAIGIATKIPGLARGGRIMMGTGPTADDVLIRVSRDETVVSAEHSRKLAPWFHAVGVPGYAAGGVVGTVKSAAGSVGKGIETAAGAVGGAASNVIQVAGKALDVGKIMVGVITGDEKSISAAFDHLVGDHHASVAVGSVMDQIFVETPKFIVKKLVSHLIDKGKAMIASSDSGGYSGNMPGSGVGRWTSTVLQALALVGLSLGFVNQVLYQMQTESGGNPRAINNWDINAINGVPSKGLMQVIDPTFRAYHVAGTAMDIWDPLANIAAALNYARNRYGPTLGALGSGHGYDSGGWLPPGASLAFNGTGRPEAILSQSQWNTLYSSARGGDGGTEYHAHFDGLTSGAIGSHVRTAFRAMGIQEGNKQRVGRRR